MESPVMSPARKEPDTSTYSGIVSRRIRELRDRKNLSVPDVVEQMASLGFATTEANVRHWENGTSKPNLDAIPYLAQVLGVKKSQFFPD